MRTLLALAVLLASPAWLRAQETVIPVEAGARLAFEGNRGRVHVTAWDRNAVRVSPGRGSDVEVDRAGAVVRVRTADLHRAAGDAEVAITVPRWMDVRIEGNHLTVTVTGTRGEVRVETVNGAVVVDGGAGDVSASTIQGAVTVRNASGRINARSVNESVRLTDVSGDIQAETTNGSITMRGVRSPSVRATTVNGSVDFQGTIEDDGRYVFATHNGSLAVAVPASTNATVTVSTYHGGFQSDFPVQLTGTTRDRQFNFTLGTGSARMALESFNGEIRLRRPPASRQN